MFIFVVFLGFVFFGFLFLVLFVFLFCFFLFLKSQSASCMLNKHIPSTMVCMHQLKIRNWNVPDNGGGRFGYYHIPTKLVCNLRWNNIHFNAKYVALLAICSFGTLILLSFNTDPPVKFLIFCFTGIVVSGG